MNPQDPISAVTLQAAMDVFIAFHVVYKLSKVYEPNNRQFEERMEALLSGLQKVSAGGEVQIRIQDGRVFINRLRLKFNIVTLPLFQYMRDEFQRHQLGMIALLPGLTGKELQRFVVFLNKNQTAQADPFERLAEEFQVAAFPHLRLEKYRAAAFAAAAEGKAVPMYFLGIYHLKDIFDARQGILNLHVTKRYIQTICNLLSLDESVLFGMTSVKNFEEYTLNHSVNVCVLSLALGRRLGLSRPDLINLGIGACLHDVGKFEIPTEVLEKPGRLDADERATIEKHPHRGAARLIHTRATQQIPIPAIMIALEHHMTPKFEGYPKYAWRYKTSLFSKIVKVVDYYDAITTKRIYRPKTFTPGEAVQLMLERGEEEFDPLILKAFVHMIGVYPIGSLVVLDSAEIGIVVGANPNPGLLARPKVKLITDARGVKTDGAVVDLGDKDETGRLYQRSILTTLDADKYGLRISDYLLADNPLAAPAD
jgi:HD-GYP domain-containing protein (c-di-GMP phosphodiesterase class II)